MSGNYLGNVNVGVIDWPICSMSSYVDFVRGIELTPEARHLIMYENARRLFKLPLPPIDLPTEAPSSLPGR